MNPNKLDRCLITASDVEEDYERILNVRLSSWALRQYAQAWRLLSFIVVLTDARKLRKVRNFGTEEPVGARSAGLESVDAGEDVDGVGAENPQRR